ncbi:MAG: hypothetical protein WD906_00370 [Anaerolineales bacterium]
MRGARPRPAIAASLAVLGFASLACQVWLGGPTAPPPLIPISTEAAGEVARAWQDALLASAATGEIAIILNESQVTSYLAARLARSDNPILVEPQVHLREGVMEIYGKTVQGPFEAGVRIELEPQLNSEGQLGFAISSIDLGPLPAPEALTEGLSSVLTEAFAGTLGSLATGFRITTLAIAHGEIALIGTVR